jgi:cytochrome c oxidase cbb3-type subunit 3
MKKIIRSIILTALLVVAATVVAEAQPKAGNNPMLENLEVILWILAVGVVAGAFFELTRIYGLALRKEILDMEAAKGISHEKVQKPSFWKRVGKMLQNDVPIAQEENILFEHEFDGIRELDNKLPAWWVWMFYLTIGFGVVYFMYYDVLKIGDSSHEKFVKQMEEGKKQKEEYLASIANLVNEENVELLTDENALAEGAKIFKQNCVACHLDHGGGAPTSIGPNLTDEYWLHGGGIKNVFATIKNGVPTKGMIAWKDQMSPVDIHKVSSYVVSLQGTNPAGAKEPQGDKWVAEAVTEKSDSTATE